jgi:hypothetical protein
MNIVAFIFFVVVVVWVVITLTKTLSGTPRDDPRSPDAPDEAYPFETFFKDIDLPPVGSRLVLREGWGIEISTTGGCSIRLGPGDSLLSKPDCLAVYKEVKLADSRYEHNDRYLDWDSIDSIYVSRPLLVLIDWNDEDEPEEPHPMLCFEHGGSEGCEAVNEEHGFTCPKCEGGGRLTYEKMLKLQESGWKVGDADDFLDDIGQKPMFPPARVIPEDSDKPVALKDCPSIEPSTECGAVNPHPTWSDKTCVLPKGHKGRHEWMENMIRGVASVSWENEEDQEIQ